MLQDDEIVNKRFHFNYSLHCAKVLNLDLIVYVHRYAISAGFLG